ncbi:hypothetical protein AZZ73_001577 [Klebsiella pneumoniae]|nr:hypothetical protein AZZ73_001577 [Klebsiella pneumoniae]
MSDPVSGTTVAVSYTHLDVYKRQASGFEVFLAVYISLPVSYTHLDVYKRQAQY